MRYAMARVIRAFSLDAAAYAMPARGVSYAVMSCRYRHAVQNNRAAACFAATRRYAATFALLSLRAICLFTIRYCCRLPRLDAAAASDATMATR